TDIYTETYGDSSIQTDRHIYTETYGHTLSFSHNLIALSLQHLYTHKITHSLFLDKVQSMSFSRMNMKMCVCVCVCVCVCERVSLRVCVCLIVDAQGVTACDGFH